jgi:hypothetical protein
MIVKMLTKFSIDDCKICRRNGASLLVVNSAINVDLNAISLKMALVFAILLRY